MSAQERGMPAAAATRAGPQRVLVFNFFAGIKNRGIPAYTSGILESFRRSDILAFELRGPAWMQHAPRWLLNATFVFFEQLVAPIMRSARHCSLTIYPYNSAGIIDAVLGKSVLIVHDLIPNSKERRQPAARYIRFTQAIHRRLARPICAASSHTLTFLRRLAAFARCPLYLWCNAFYEFETAAREARPPARWCESRPLRVLLCSGMGPNKDYAGAVRQIRRSEILRNANVRIVGFGDDAPLAYRRIARLKPDVRERISVLPRLTLEQMRAAFEDSDVVWVHSLQEGFGRFLFEGRIHARPVIATDIISFRKLRWLGLTLYRPKQFDEQLHALLMAPAAPLDQQTLRDWHEGLERAVREVLIRHGS